MIRIKDLHEHEGSLITGDFLLTECQELGSNGAVRQQLALHDGSGQVTGFIWPEHRRNANIPALPSAVRLQAEVRMFKDRPQLHVHCLQVATPDMIESASALLPIAHCPQVAQPALAELVDLEASLYAPLDEFLRRVLLDPAIGLPLLTCRASVNHHHAFQGGLLVHTMECVSLTATAIARFLPEDPQSVAIGSLCQLFHDLGKLCSVGDCRRPRHPFAMRHEVYTVRLLDPHLRWLAPVSPELNAAFEYVLDCGSQAGAVSSCGHRCRD